MKGLIDDVAAALPGLAPGVLGMIYQILAFYPITPFLGHPGRILKRNEREDLHPQHNARPHSW